MNRKGWTIITGLVISISIYLVPIFVSQVKAANIVTPWDSIPDFCENPTKTSTGSGNWSSASTWSPSGVPGANDKVLISQNHTVTFDVSSTPSLDCVGIKGTLNFRTDTNTSLKAGTIMVYDVGHLLVGTVSNPIASNVTAEIVIANKAINIGIDPSQFGTSLLVLGQIQMHGATKNPTFVRLATEPLAGQSTLQLSAAPSGWRVGDRIFIPDSRHLRGNEINADWLPAQPQWEERTIQSISGSTITLTQPLTYNHNGARDGNSNLDFLPHVGNLTRNVIIRSELTMGSGTQGHALFTHRANVDIRYVWFKDLGRTQAAATGAGNQIGRYALHIHHVMGPIATPVNGYQFTLTGNAIDGGPTNHNLRWALAIHDSHYGLIKDNVAYNYHGWIIGTEDGSESYNVFDHNLAVRGTGCCGRNGGMQEANEGGGFTFRGPNNYIRNNVTANIYPKQADAGYGYKHAFEYLGQIKIPNFKGADTSVAGQYTSRDGNAIALLEFANNEVYASQSGYTNWWVGSFSTEPRTSDVNLMKDFKIWNVFNKGIFNYPSGHYVYDNLVIRGNPTSDACCSTGFEGGDYHLESLVIKNSDIQGYKFGIIPTLDQGTGLQIIENTKLRNLYNIFMMTLGTSAYAADGIPRRSVEARNVKFEAWPGQTFKSIHLEYLWSGTRNLTQLDEIKIFNYNQIPGDNFQAYYSEQRPDFILPQTIYAPDGYSNFRGSPEAGLTNLQNWNKYGIAFAGAVASCTDTITRPEISGITCSSAPLAPSPNILPTINLNHSAIYGYINQGDSATLRWSVNNATSVTIDQGIGTVAATGNRTVTPSSSTYYTLTATNTQGSVTRTLLLTVQGTTTPPAPPPNPPPPPTPAPSPSPSPLIVDLRFENNAQDQSGNGNHGQLMGSGVQYGTGRIGNGVVFDGTNGYVQVPDSASLDSLGTQFTVSGWFKVTTPAFDPHDTLISKTFDWEVSPQAFLVTTERNGTVIVFGASTMNSATAWAPWEDKGWHHLAVVFDGTTASIYGDGSYKGQSAITAAGTNNLPLTIGAFGGNQLEGAADEIRIFKKLLTSAEVLSEYQRAGDTTAPTVSISAPTSGAIISGNAVSITANASDNIGVVGVQFRLDGTNLGAEDTTAPYSFTWNSTTASNGSHSLTAVARDAAGNATTSAATNVTVSNSNPTPTPLAGDLNLDHIVNSIDFSLLNSKWFTSDSTADINKDGIVNSLDFSIMNGNWFKTW